MPFSFQPFGNKFSPKKSSPRKAVSLSALQNLDKDTLQKELSVNDKLDKIKINLDGNKILFDGSRWISEGGGGVNHKELTSLKKQNDRLLEENNLLKLKTEILIDMLAQTTADQLLQSKEIDELKAMVRNKQSARER